MSVLDGYNAFSTVLGRPIIPADTCELCTDHPAVQEILAAAKLKIPSQLSFNSLKEYKESYLSRDTIFAHILKQHDLLTEMSQVKSTALLYSVAAIESVRTTPPPVDQTSVPAQYLQIAEDACRELLATKTVQLPLFISSLLQLYHSRQMDNRISTSFLLSQTIAFCTDVGLHLPPSPSQSMWTFDRSPALAQHVEMYSKLFWLSYSWHCQIISDGSPHRPLLLPPSAIRLSLPGKSRSSCEDPRVFFELDPSDSFGLYVKASLLLGQVHEYRSLVYLNQNPSSPPHPEHVKVLQHRLLNFGRCVQAIEGQTGKTSSTMTALAFTDTALLKLYETTLQFTTDYLASLWDTLARISNQAGVFRHLLDSGAIRARDVDVHMISCWGTAATLASEMDDYLAAAGLPSMSDLWSSIKLGLTEMLDLLGEEYPVARRVAEDARRPKFKRLSPQQTPERRIPMTPERPLFTRSWTTSQLE